MEDVELTVVGGGLVWQSCGTKCVYLVGPFYEGSDAEVLEWGKIGQ